MNERASTESTFSEAPKEPHEEENTPETAAIVEGAEDLMVDDAADEANDIVASMPQELVAVILREEEREDEKTAGSKSPGMGSKGSISNFGSFDDDLLGDPNNKEGPNTAPSIGRTSLFELQSEAITKSVTPQRKDQLLLQARSDRLRWIQQVPLPYETKDTPDCRFSRFLHYSHATLQLPAVANVLQHLYGQEREHDMTADRVDALLLESSSSVDEQRVHLTGNQILAAEIEAASDPETKATLQSYQSFLNSLQDPACAVLVQGIRTFCRNFRDSTDSATASSKLKFYVGAAFETVKQHSVFKAFDENMLRRSLESFVFGHCRSHLESLMRTTETAANDKAFREKLQSLQFVTPSHLEIHCLANQPDDVLKTLLAKSVAALQSVDSYHSVYEKLQRILAIYREANAALTTALQHGSSDKLPSADDVLPTIILTVLKANPIRLSFNLQLVEELSPPGYLRGEAGYAYTNLYGAFQFLQDLDFDKEPASLSISKDAFCEAIAAHRSEVEKRLQTLDKRSLDVAVSATIDEDIVLVTTNSPSPLEIRQARLRGEKVDLDWALQWQEKYGHNMDSSERSSECPRSAIEKAEQGLPTGFRRTYSFLTTRSEDIRVSDLPLLLDEYRMLVHATENLLGERVLKAAAERKAKARAIERDLLAAARSLDPAHGPDFLMAGRPLH